MPATHSTLDGPCRFRFTPKPRPLTIAASPNFSRTLSSAQSTREAKALVELAVRGLLPGIVGADISDVPLRIAAGEERATVFRVLQRHHDLRTRGNGTFVYGAGIVNYYASALCIRTVRPRRLHKLTIVVVARTAQHDHAIAEDQLGARPSTLFVVQHRRTKRCLVAGLADRHQVEEPHQIRFILRCCRPA